MVLVLHASKGISDSGAVVAAIFQVGRGRATVEMATAIHQDPDIAGMGKIVGVGGVEGIWDVVDLVVEVTPTVREQKGISPKDFVLRLGVLCRGAYPCRTDGAAEGDECQGTMCSHHSRTRRHANPPQPDAIIALR